MYRFCSLSGITRRKTKTFYPEFTSNGNGLNGLKVLRDVEVHFVTWLNESCITVAFRDEWGFFHESKLFGKKNIWDLKVGSSLSKIFLLLSTKLSQWNSAGCRNVQGTVFGNILRGKIMHMVCITWHRLSLASATVKQRNTSGERQDICVVLKSSCPSAGTRTALTLPAVLSNISRF